MTTIDGLTSGLDTSSIINQLMQIERRPVVRLEQRQAQERAAKTELTGIRSDVNNLKTLASDLRLPTGWNKVAATTSNEEAVTVNPGSGDFTGNFSFTVSKLAQPKAIYSEQTFASLDDTVSSGGSVFAAIGAGELGFGSMSGTGFGDEAVDFEVTQPSQPATVTGAKIPIIPITIDGANDGVTFEVNGFSYSIALEHKIYDTEQALADAVQAAIDGDPGASTAATASLLDGEKLSVQTIAEGSDHSLTVLSGTAITALGLNPGAGATGVDAVVTVDGTTTSISDVSEGATATIFSGSGGQIAATLGGPITAGSATVQQSGFGSGSLRDVVESINSTDGLGFSAAAINTGNGYILSLTSKDTGADAEIDMDLSVFDGFTGFKTLSEGSDAELTVNGDEPYTVVSSTNEFNEILPGVGVTVNQVTTDPVTITVKPDDEQLADSVSEMVDKLNALISRTAAATASDPTADSRSVLQGNSSVRRAESELRQAVVSPVDASAFTSAGSIGIELNRDGTIDFDREKFLESVTENREAVQRLFAAPLGTLSTEEGVEGAEAGILDRVIAAASASASVADGYLTTATEAVDRQIDDYTDQIESYERRLELRESTLRRTYANLEVLLGGLQQQSGYLASQLGSLGGTS